MKVELAPRKALTIVSLLAACANPAFSQGLPPTNMGKFVHQPGDNQYAQQAQNERHGAPPVMNAPAPVSNGGSGGYQGWQPTPAPHRPDISLEPIAADEPIPPKEFPPMPEKIDLPIVQTSWSGGGGGGYGGPSPGMAQGGAPQPTGVHQHYQHYDAGAFIPQNQGGGGGGQGPAPGQTHGYYKANTPNTDFYSSAQGGSGAGLTPSEQALKRMGREPRMHGDGAPSADAPQPVVVNQATTQDLSLPDDDFNIRSPQAVHWVQRLCGG